MLASRTTARNVEVAFTSLATPTSMRSVSQTQDVLVDALVVVDGDGEANLIATFDVGDLSAVRARAPKEEASARVGACLRARSASFVWRRASREDASKRNDARCAPLRDVSKRNGGSARPRTCLRICLRAYHACLRRAGA